MNKPTDKEQAHKQFAREWPDVTWLREYLDILAQHTPEVFIEPPTDMVIQCYSMGYAIRDFVTMYKLGGHALADMVLAEYEEREDYEACAAIQQALGKHYQECREIHQTIRRLYGRD
ncbi:hypothetical protein J7E24_07170 [Hymenobacter sp. ISL-91]|uniref:hypothetical protein n=1 Tax=Hymenobacter sp. ISL-91 TaxID=2819151 RepID=UPI001BE8A120|nr:hypothetical protein [Hymenobacter sp. ISL-91]MBT2557558.1 hypothetical protein [Hymenobacter sp. ISL-91]